MHAEKEKAATTEARLSRYMQLKSWYLARLRKRALEQHDKNLTPAALINADRSLIESLVLASKTDLAVKEQEKTEVQDYRLPAYGLILALLYLALLNSMGGNVLECSKAYFSIFPASLLGKTDIQTLQSKAGWLPAAISFFGFTAAALFASAPSFLRAIKQKSNHLLLRALLLQALAIAPFLAALFLAADSGSSSASALNILFSLSAWSGLLSSILAFHLQKTVLEPEIKLLEELASKADVERLNGNFLETAIRQVEELINQRNELSNRETLIADASPDLLFVLNQDSIILASNWTVQSLLGFLPEEIVGKPLSNLVLSLDLNTVNDSLAKAKSSKQGVSFDCRMLTKLRKAADLRWHLEYSATENCYFASAQDISDEKTLERAKKEFVAMLGHDIKVPLTSSLLSVQVLLQGVYGDLSSSSKNSLVNVETSLKRLILLLEELLEFEQLSAGQMKLSSSPISLLKLLNEALSEVTGQAENKAIKLILEAEDRQIVADYGKLLRVVVNLLSNAIKFSPKETSVLLSAAVTRSGNIEIRVKDEGPGIAAEYQKLVFERYERLAATAKEEGSGLGLAIARAIVESHGGMIGVESEPGKGSTFWLTLPNSKS
ncbi:MAG: PAS domain-containing sensor histidine kinase [Candidatus Obscuribacterales bacterium]|nr:PAS domain-containing sensor histidine kinase [Candidatus Obscuribacterales bacterium]